jgi:hypothetical protein
MPTTSNAPSTKALPRAFWLYLLGVHSVYALTLTQHFTHLEAPELDLRWLSFAEFATLLDLVLLPALVYAFLTRRQPKQALFGALGMMMLGLLAVRIWFPHARMGAGLQWALDARSMLMPVLWGVAIALEVYVLSQLLRFLLKPMKEGAVAVMIEPIAMSLGRDHWLCRWVAAETRIWIYALSKTLPSFEAKCQCLDVAGIDHCESGAHATAPFYSGSHSLGFGVGHNGGNTHEFAVDVGRVSSHPIAPHLAVR